MKDGDPAPVEVALRDVGPADLETLFEHQADPRATAMAVFPARDHAAFMTHWRGVLADTTIVKKAVLHGDDLAGYVACFEHRGRRLIGYWLGRGFWGRGIGTAALRVFLREVPMRPLHAFVAASNAASIRILESAGFESLEDPDAGPEERVFVLRDSKRS